MVSGQRAPATDGGSAPLGLRGGSPISAVVVWDCPVMAEIGERLCGLLAKVRSDLRRQCCQPASK